MSSIIKASIEFAEIKATSKLHYNVQNGSFVLNIFTIFQSLLPPFRVPKRASWGREGSDQGWRGGALSQDTPERMLLPLYRLPRRASRDCKGSDQGWRGQPNISSHSWALYSTHPLYFNRRKGEPARVCAQLRCNWRWKVTSYGRFTKSLAFALLSDWFENIDLSWQ